MNFGRAIEEVKQGAHARRGGWNGKAQYIFFMDERDFGRRQSYIAMMMEEETSVPWLASQTDMTRDDWVIWGGQYEPSEAPDMPGA